MGGGGGLSATISQSTLNALICTIKRVFTLSICSYQLAPAYLCRLYSMAIRALLGVDTNFRTDKYKELIHNLKNNLEKWVDRNTLK